MKKITATSVCLIAGTVMASGPVEASSKVAEVFQADMVNARIAYLESIIGPAKDILTLSGYELREYKVEGCNITVHAENDKAVQYGIALTPKCHIDLEGLLGKSFTTRGLTIDKFLAEKSGILSARADCVTMCGNSSDPSINFIWEGSRADNFLNVALTIELSSDASLNAINKWEGLVEKNEGEDYLIDTKFNCTNRYDDAAINVFRKVPVTSFSFGSRNMKGDFGTAEGPCK